MTETMQRTITELVTVASDALGELARAAIGDRAVGILADDELCAFVADLEQAGRLLDTLRAVGAAQVDERSNRFLGNQGLAARLGYLKPGILLEQLTRSGGVDVARRIRLGHSIEPRVALGGEQLPAARPVLASAMAEGLVGDRAAAEIISCLAAAAPAIDDELLRAGETSLTEAASEDSADLVAMQARVWREALDPDGAEPREEALRRKRSFVVGREVNGMTPFHGITDPVSGELLRSMLSNGSNPKAPPRFISDFDREAGQQTNIGEDGQTVLTFVDPRTREQRQHDILIGVVTAGVRASEAAPSLRPVSSVTAVVSMRELESGTGAGWLENTGEPISIATITQLICEGGMRTMVVGDSGEVLYLGHPRRLFSAAQRRALAVRDGGCVWPGCSAPPGWCEAHHVIPWAEEGPTDIDNGALLCSAHHHMLHASQFRMRMVDGRPQLLAPPLLDPLQVWKSVGRCRAMLAA